MPLCMTDAAIILFGCKCISGNIFHESMQSAPVLMKRLTCSWTTFWAVGHGPPYTWLAISCVICIPLSGLLFFWDNPPGIRHGNGKTSLYTDNVLTYLIWTDERVIFHSQFWLRNASSYMQLQLLEGVKAPSCCFQFGSWGSTSSIPAGRPGSNLAAALALCQAFCMLFSK